VLETAIAAARKAGQLLVDLLNNPRQTQVKGQRDIVTDADFKAQEAIIACIRRRFPDHAIVAEEGRASWPDEATYTWVIDPLDGTTNYARRYPFFSVSIAVWHKEGPIIGVVYDPLRDALFWAQRGEGAFLNGRPIHVSSTGALARAVISLGWARESSLRTKTAQWLACLSDEVLTVRGSGSAALDLCAVAAGWTDIYFHLALESWDMAAGGLIVQEAGGTVTDATGKPWNHMARSCLASNSYLHPILLEYLSVS